MADAFLTRKGGEDVTPEVNEQTVIIQDIMEALVGKVYGANATSETILKGYSAYVHQNLVEGTYEPVDGIDFGEVTLTASAETVEVNHNLKTIPNAAFLVPIESTRSIGSNQNFTWFSIYPIVRGGTKYAYVPYNNYSGESSSRVPEMTTDKITFKSYSSSRPFQDAKYRWIALA